MNKILIIYPHWHPSNLAGVHRPRLLGNFLKEFGWVPRVLTVEPEYFEEKPDPDFEKTFSEDFVITRVKANRITRVRIIGDIGLRAFFQLRKAALKIIREEKPDFLWIPVPSFYTSLLGRMLNKKTGIPYGIDYIDPWIRPLRKNEGTRARLSQMVARILEPMAVRRASLISGVSEAYYQPVIERNFRNKHIEHCGMPYGFDPRDHEIAIQNSLNNQHSSKSHTPPTTHTTDSTVQQFNASTDINQQSTIDNRQSHPFPWVHIHGCKPLVYAGAFLPGSGLLAKAMFRAVRELRDSGEWDTKFHLFFLGTGHYSHRGLMEYAREEGVEDIVHEYRDRYPYLHILNFLSKSQGVIILGSVEKHYTASKIFQSLLSRRPVFAILHEESSAVSILEEIEAGNFMVKFRNDMSSEELKNNIKNKFIQFLNQTPPWKPDLVKFDEYSARKSAKKLLEKVELIIS